MNWFYAIGEEQKGPIGQNEFDTLVQEKVIQPETLVWCQGMPQWQPWSTLASAATAQVVPAPPPITGQRPCAECGQLYSSDDLLTIEGTSICADCKPKHLQRLKEGVLPGGSQLRRDGSILMCSTDTALPDRCIQCNADAPGPRLRRKLHWHSSWIYALILVSLWIYLIVALCVRKSGVIHFNVCPLHRRKHLQWSLIGWSSALIGLGGFLGFMSSNQLGAAFFCLVTGLVLCIVAALKARYLKATKIEGDQMQVQGVCSAMLEAYPQWSQNPR